MRMPGQEHASRWRKQGSGEVGKGGSWEARKWGSGEVGIMAEERPSCSLRQ